MTIHTDVRSYYVAEWGAPDREAVFEKEDFTVQVLKWRSSEITQGVNFYATAGASNYPLPGRQDEHRREFFAALTPEFDNIASPLARLGIYAQLTGNEMSAGHTYRALQGLADGTAFAGFAILEPVDNYPAPVHLADGRHVEFLLAVPLHDNELDHAASKSVGDLLRRMEDVGAPLWNPYRNSVFE